MSPSLKRHASKQASRNAREATAEKIAELTLQLDVARTKAEQWRDDWIAISESWRKRAEKAEFELSDWRECARRTAEEECAPDERHCGCVASLRMEMARLKAQCARLDKSRRRWAKRYCEERSGREAGIALREALEANYDRILAACKRLHWHWVATSDDLRSAESERDSLKARVGELESEIHTACGSCGTPTEPAIRVCPKCLDAWIGKIGCEFLDKANAPIRARVGELEKKCEELERQRAIEEARCHGLEDDNASQAEELAAWRASGDATPVLEKRIDALEGALRRIAEYRDYPNMSIKTLSAREDAELARALLSAQPAEQRTAFPRPSCCPDKTCNPDDACGEWCEVCQAQPAEHPATNASCHCTGAECDHSDGGPCRACGCQTPWEPAEQKEEEGDRNG